MYLKSLEIQGFKSFPDKTVLQFGSDITAIVGPNGSGKSNISDAICWVMGEQSSKALRGAKMEDVIFGGTARRPAVGYAEATLVLDNAEGTLPIETPEVMITRRYFRSGESEYYINKQQARLKDVNELLMDTGLGREGYSNIGQGKVDEILALRSTDRREVFEEAAGISKFRHRKEETERRLAATEENLLRIGDKISELELQVEPLREQAEKAKKYLTLRDELKGLEVTLWLSGLARAGESARKAEKDYASAAFILSQAHDELTELYSQSEQLSLQYNQKTLLLDHMHEEISTLEAQAQGARAEIAVLENDIQNHTQNMERARQELSDQQSRSGSLQAQLDEQVEKQKALLSEQETLSAELAGRQEEAARLARQSAQTDEAASALLQKQAAAQADFTARQATLASLQAGMSEVSARRKALLADLDSAEARSDQLEQQRRECRKRLQQAQEAVQSANNTIAGYALRLKTRREKQQALQKQADAAGVELDTMSARARMLREMERDFEGYSKAVRLVCQEAERGRLPGVHGPVSRLIRVADEYTTAIETALGAAMQNLVVDDESCGKAAIQFLKRTQAGRATFLPLSTIRGARMQPGTLAGQRGFVGVASGLVQTDARYEQVLESLLGRTVIAETLDDAIAMSRACGARTRIVTLDGQVMNAGGSMTGGASAKSAGVLARGNQLSQLEQACVRQEKKLQELKGALQQAAAAAAKTEFECSAVQGQLREAEDEVLRRTEEEKQAALLRQTVDDARASLRQELERLDSRTGSDQGRISELQAQLDAARTALEELERTYGALRQTRSRLDADAQAAADAVAGVTGRIAANRAAQEAAQTTHSQLQALQQQLQGDAAQKRALLAGFEEKISSLRAQKETAQARAAALDGQTQQRQQALRAAVEARTQLEARRTQAEKQAQEKNQSILQLERESARLEQKKAACQTEEKQLIDKLWDSYELTPSTAEPFRVELESDAQAGKRVSELRRKISALGAVNVGAIDDYARISERYEYLASQRDDVLHAKTELLNIVSSITKQMTEIFTGEFSKINAYFSQTFTEMFGGGKAELLLEDAKNPLECGIEIRVQPPGKQLKTITLLSGGEKAFVAIALYFAILKVRPTPFCMLDEIDAALDDRNVERFASYLRNLCKKTQFIVITHRRGTMEASDVLYGVTMQEQGISKILHLDLDAMAKELGITA